MPRLRTSRLELIPATEASLRAELERPDTLGTVLGCEVPASWPPELYDEDAIRYVLRQLTEHPESADWSLYYIVRLAGANSPPLLIGAGGFKGPPDEHGVTEVGYGILPEHRRVGYATEALLGLVEFSFASPAVSMVIAHTLRSLPPSIGVLEKAGFRFAGTGDDPHAPPGEEVIRYELARFGDATISTGRRQE